MPQATMYNPTTKARQAVEVGSDQATNLFGQGYFLETGYDPATKVSRYNNTPATPPPAGGGGSTSSTGGTSSDTPRVLPSNPIYRYTMDNINKVPTIDTLDESAIRKSTQDEIQKQIEAIDLAYQSVLSDARVQGEGRLGSTRTIGSRSGVLDSPMGQAQKTGMENYNTGIIKGIEAEREAKKSALYTQANSRANDLIEAKRLEIAGQKDKANEYLTKIRESAKTDATTYFKNGGKISDLSDQEYADLLNESGLTAVELAGIAKSAGKITYNYTSRPDGSILIEGSDGSYKVDNQYNIPKDKEMKQLDNGEVLIFDPTKGTYTSIGNYAKPKSSSGDTSTGEDKETKAFYDAIEKTKGDLSAGKQNWGQAFSYIKARYGAPDDVIDTLLDKGTWAKEGAYETQLKNRKTNTSSNSSIAEWLNQ